MEKSGCAPSKCNAFFAKRPKMWASAKTWTQGGRSFGRKMGAIAPLMAADSSFREGLLKRAGTRPGKSWPREEDHNLISFAQAKTRVYRAAEVFMTHSSKAKINGWGLAFLVGGHQTWKKGARLCLHFSATRQTTMLYRRSWMWQICPESRFVIYFWFPMGKIYVYNNATY